MTEPTKHITAQPDAAPPQITLEDVIETIARGAARGWTASEDVSGYASSRPYSFGVVLNDWFIPLSPRPQPSGPKY